MANRVTLKQIAAHAGVSYQTVSRVINRLPDVAPETRTRVQASIRALHYQPRQTASAFSKRNVSVIGVVFPFDPDPACSDANLLAVLYGIGLEVTLRGGSVLLSSSRSTGVPLSGCHRLLEERSVDGVILDETVGEAGARLFIEAGFPLVVLGYPAGKAVPSVHLDDEGGTRCLAQHLLESNHRRIGLIAGPGGAAMHARRLGFERAMQAAGLELDGDLTIVCQETCSGDGFRGAAQLMSLAEPPTAICVLSRYLVPGCVQWLAEHGYQIPEDISIACADEIANAELLQAPLTRVQLFPYESGRRAAAILFDLMQGQAPGIYESVVPSRLLAG